MDIKEKILFEKLQEHGVNTTFTFTKEAILDAMEEYANSITPIIQRIIALKQEYSDINDAWIDNHTLPLLDRANELEVTFRNLGIDYLPLWRTSKFNG